MVTKQDFSPTLNAKGLMSDMLFESKTRCFKCLSLENAEKCMRARYQVHSADFLR